MELEQVQDLKVGHFIGRAPEGQSLDLMKTFAYGRMMVVLSYVFLLLVTSKIVAGDNGSFLVESSQKTNLRRGLGFEQQQRQLGEDRLTSTTNRRDLVEEEELVSNSGEFPENEVVKSETEELENIEKEFDNENKVLETETEERENIEKEVDTETEVMETETEELENIEKAFGNEKEVSETETEELEDIEKVFDGENEDSASKNQETLEKEFPTKNEPTGEPPAQASSDDPTTKPYTATNNELDQEILAEEEKILAEEEEVEDLETALKQEEKVARQAGGLGIFLGIVAMIFTAHQMSDNPDGIYASICRLAITISSVGIKIMCMPCRKLIGGGSDPYSGHMPISTSDYSFRSDPYRSNANAGFEMR